MELRNWVSVAGNPAAANHFARRIKLLPANAFLAFRAATLGAMPTAITRALWSPRWILCAFLMQWPASRHTTQASISSWRPFRYDLWDTVSPSNQQRLQVPLFTI